MNLKTIAAVLLLIVGVTACDDNNNSRQALTDEQIIEHGFMEADLNGDGVIDPGETAARIKNDFDRMDQNNDGVITADDHFGPEYMGEPVTKEERSELDCDANDDETLTQTEYMNCIKETVINIMDADHNGSITLDEVKAFKNNQEL
jgi:Ca2+-binding EF-hand superfamily protein